MLQQAIISAAITALLFLGLGLGGCAGKRGTIEHLNDRDRAQLNNLLNGGSK